jgi:hypothetical protein
MNENKLVGFDPQIFKEQKQVVEAIITDGEDIEFEENIENMLDYLENENDEEGDVEEDGEE